MWLPTNIISLKILIFDCSAEMQNPNNSHMRNLRWRFNPNLWWCLSMSDKKKVITSINFLCASYFFILFQPQHCDYRDTKIWVRTCLNYDAIKTRGILVTEVETTVLSLLKVVYVQYLKIFWTFKYLSKTHF